MENWGVEKKRERCVYIPSKKSGPAAVEMT